MGRKTRQVVAGLDLGTTKICAVIGEMQADGTLDVIGVGTHPSRGLKKGVVVNIDSTVDSIRHAVEEAQLMAGLDVGSVYVGIAGGHIASINSRGIIAVKNREITWRDVEQVIDAARAVALPMDREVIHVLPQEFLVDDQGGITEPLGMAGKRLEVRVHLVTAAVASAHNIVKCVHKAGLDVDDIVLAQLASGEATLAAEERELGVAVVDVGGGTTDLAVFAAGGVKHTAVLAVGGNHITNDLAFGLGVPVQEAERVKQAFGCAHPSLLRANETVEVRRVGERAPLLVKRRDLCEIIAPRVEEILQMVQQELRHHGCEALPAGVVLTGGTALLPGIVELTEEVLRVPVRRGVPVGIGGLVEMVKTPRYATAIGLLRYGLKERRDGKAYKFTGDHLFARVYYRMREWFSELLA
ncbi:MAG: cell division protein FtsA [Candidatus Tectimicrobiota bacterium]|nr:MAG: cell division protein FtsA [Candidatus Tectomicrobia bacterium]